MINIPDSKDVHLMLSLMQSFPRKLVPMYRHEYEGLRVLVGNVHERIIKDEHGHPKVFMVNKETAITKLKQMYGFFTKQEAQTELIEAVKDFSGES